jgi:hypothetical protein
MKDKTFNFTNMLAKDRSSLLNVDEETDAIEEQLRAAGMLPVGAKVRIWDVDASTQIAMFEHIKKSIESALVVCGYSESPKPGTVEAVRFMAVAGLVYRFLADAVGYGDDAEEADELGHSLALHIAQGIHVQKQEDNPSE